MADERSGAASSDVTVEPTSLAAVLSALSLGGVRSGIKASSREGGIVLSIALSGPGEVSGKPQKVTSETPKSTPKAEKVAPKPEKSTSEAPKITPKPEKSTSGSENAAKLSEGPFPIRAATFVYFDASGKEILRVKKRRVIKSYVMTAPYHKLKDLGAKGGFFRLFGENPATGEPIELSKSTGLPAGSSLTVRPHPAQEKAPAEKESPDAASTGQEGGGEGQESSAEAKAQKAPEAEVRAIPPSPATEARKAPAKLSAIPMERTEAVKSVASAPGASASGSNKYAFACRKQRGVSSCSECLRHGHCDTESYGAQKPQDAAVITKAIPPEGARQP